MNITLKELDIVFDGVLEEMENILLLSVTRDTAALTVQKIKNRLMDRELDRLEAFRKKNYDQHTKAYDIAMKNLCDAYSHYHCFCNPKDIPLEVNA